MSVLVGRGHHVFGVRPLLQLPWLRADIRPGALLTVLTWLFGGCGHRALVDHMNASMNYASFPSGESGLVQRFRIAISALTVGIHEVR